MVDSGTWHQFVCNGKSWTVARRTKTEEKQTGLCFRRDSETRFLVFTRGALPSDRELQSMSEEVLCALLQRSVVQ
jgi:hypothetical protein